MRWMLPFVVVVVGCVATLPSDDGLTADIAAETARMVVQLRQQIPPTPAPPSDGKCIPCNGTGTLPTDGRIVIKCEACGGTGKAKK